MPDRPQGARSRAVVRPRPGVLWRELEGEAVLLDPRSSVYFSLNAVGTRVWCLLEEGLPLDQVHAALQAEYEVEAGTLWRDLDELVRRLAEEGLVDLEPESEIEPRRGAGGGEPGDGRTS